MSRLSASPSDHASCAISRKRRFRLCQPRKFLPGLNWADVIWSDAGSAMQSTLQASNFCSGVEVSRSASGQYAKGPYLARSGDSVRVRTFRWTQYGERELSPFKALIRLLARRTLLRVMSLYQGEIPALQAERTAACQFLVPVVQVVCGVVSLAGGLGRRGAGR